MYPMTHSCEVFMKNKKTPPVPLEKEEDATFFEWAELKSIKCPELVGLYHIPNEKAWTLGRKQGVVPGVFDWHLPVASNGYIGCWIEMKRRNGGRVSPAQLEWMLLMRGYGHFAEVCRGSDEAIKAICVYLGISERL